MMNAFPDYVYTLEAVRGRLRRGHRSVLLFLPNDGRLIKVTKGNLKKSAARFRHSLKHGQA